jgi:hypothetical protein
LRNLFLHVEVMHQKDMFSVKEGDRGGLITYLSLLKGKN